MFVIPQRGIRGHTHQCSAVMLTETLVTLDLHEKFVLYEVMLCVTASVFLQME